MHLLCLLLLSIAAVGLARPRPGDPEGTGEAVDYRGPTPFAILHAGHINCADGGDLSLIPFGESDSECTGLSAKPGNNANSLSTSIDMACITYNDENCKEKMDTLTMKPSSCWNFSNSVKSFKCFL
ncbi:hypothetical protein H112_02698 [Trichophyton rubrum D6]|uniref:Secreted protein n=3 Tax=Trichophyton TaxID=5550 RepID=F2STY8_TRIRC|nr:uncharacterized protein TERG_06457 [Trichophyton rubrum CBS 118892]EZF24815.1 hypothetical protein H100_02704 [Trichophyton rubrum MR850]EZF43868.1 hypothetical protein H102_02696 [Trichophyton rubrum CBS 100081]EZF54514.1 hypothetical protein H103_02708 [Trichophyton rubrum CBS 288.86]EZF65081.1 hypothetical protein H104_02687 [Trichophyton rubrum CBS 289.86]EZF75748.1 hypothetical protein H105_02714 [Trichophyton soudanense CBS 452.61]EZF86442.1 hypothetical protein H110_02706 [Trichophy